MSVITKKKLLHLSKLCAIKLQDNEVEKYLNQLDGILTFVSQLKEVDVENVEPLVHPIENHYLEPKKGVDDFKNNKGLFKNVKHSIRNNMIVIKSAIK